MTHTKLTDLWKKQRDQFQLWHNALVRLAGKLRNEVQSQLSPNPDTWAEHDTGRVHRYVEVRDISPTPQPFGQGLSQASITENGELMFGLVITFDHGANTYPKEMFHVPVAVREVAPLVKTVPGVFISAIPAG